MFAVPGWSVPAAALKTQEDSTGKILSKTPKLKDGKSFDKPSKKRKRGLGQANGINVTEENLADLWRKHIEGKSKLGERGRDRKKKRRTEKLLDGNEAPAINVDTSKKEAVDHGAIQAEATTSKSENNMGVTPLPQTLEPEKSMQIVSAEVNTADSKQFIKGKLGERKRRTLERREKKALFQAQVSGILPPPRPTESHDAPSIVNNPNSTSTVKSTESLPQTALPKFSNAAASNPTTDGPRSTPKTMVPQPQPPLKSQGQPSTSRLTPLQQSMQSKLISARFRHLNQTLYTTPSQEASQIFTDTPSAFSSYHAGFRAQVAVWPQNPVDTFIQDVKARGKVGSGRDSQKKLWRQERKGQGKGKPDGNKQPAGPEAQDQDQDPLPRTRGLCTLADLGCGDACFAASLTPLSKSLHLRLHSFDLAQGDGPNASLVTVADIAKLHLADGSVDVAVLCLALMGTNWIEFVEEVGRVVRWGGECWVAEIKSRFGRPATKKGAIGKKKKGKEEEEEELMVEVEEELKGKEGEKTDVNAFIEVWRRRGFELKGEADVENKMFVRMRFVRKLVPTVGKGVPLTQDTAVANERDGDRGNGRYKAKKFLTNSRYEDVDEGKVLKPCVYKIR